MPLPDIWPQVVNKEAYNIVVSDTEDSRKHVIKQIWMRPTYIRYTQAWCSSKVHTGHEGKSEPIDRCIQEMLDKKTIFEDIFPCRIQCFTLLRDTYSLDNRRLFIARVLEGKGILETIPVVLLPFRHPFVQSLRLWLDKANTTNRGNEIHVESKFWTWDPGCQDLGFTLPLCETMRDEVQKAEEMLAKVQWDLRWLGGSEEWVVNAPGKLAQVLWRWRSSIPKPVLEAEDRVQEAKLKMNSDVVLMTISTSVFTRRLAFDVLLGCATEYKMRLGFWGSKDGEVEIFAWPDEECPSFTNFRAGCMQVLEELHALNL